MYSKLAKFRQQSNQSKITKFGHYSYLGVFDSPMIMGLLDSARQSHFTIPRSPVAYFGGLGHSRLGLPLVKKSVLTIVKNRKTWLPPICETLSGRQEMLRMPPPPWSPKYVIDFFDVNHQRNKCSSCISWTDRDICISLTTLCWKGKDLENI